MCTRQLGTCVKRCLPLNLRGTSATSTSGPPSSSFSPIGVHHPRRYHSHQTSPPACTSYSPSRHAKRGGAARSVSSCSTPSPSTSSSLPASAAWGAAGGVKRHTAAFTSASKKTEAALAGAAARCVRGTHICASIASPAAVDADAASSSVEEALEEVQQRLGFVLSEEPTVPPPHPAVIVISGPSGVGKDAVIRRLQELRELHMVVTATSRGMRPGEVDGVDYFFVSTPEFEDMIDQGELIEHAVVYGEYKGIPKQQSCSPLVRGPLRVVREKLGTNTDVVLRLDVQGAATVRALIPGAVFIFLVAESEAVLGRRLATRQTESPDKLALRVRTAREETARGVGEFDYVVVNAHGRLHETAEKLAAIIDVEKMRRGRERVVL